jgi:hypothetical protein
MTSTFVSHWLVTVSILSTRLAGKDLDISGRTFPSLLVLFELLVLRPHFMLAGWLIFSSSLLFFSLFISCFLCFFLPGVLRLDSHTDGVVSFPVTLSDFARDEPLYNSKEGLEGLVCFLQGLFLLKDFHTNHG